jgi:hypothetical protein
MFFFNQYGAGGAKDRNADGFMPRDKQFGYMFTQGFATADELYTGVAHELGHGMFSLKHPFDNDYKMPVLSTDNLMDYNDGTHIAKWQWDLIHDPGVIVRVFERDKDAEINRTIHLALTPDGNLMDDFYLLENGKENKINTVALYVTNGQYTIDEIKYNGKDYKWNTSAKSFINGTDRIIVKKDINKQNRVNLLKSTKNECEYEYTTIYWDENDEKQSDINQTILSKIPEDVKWVLYPYTNRDLSCETDFIKDILAQDRSECSKEELERGDQLLRDNLTQTDPVHLTNVVNSVCLSSLLKLSYNEKITLFTTIARQEELKEYSELALLRLMNALYTTDYKAFYQLLESDGNKLIKHLIDEIDDVSVYFWTDKNNYTNFIGALITMFAIAPESIADRWNVSDDDFVNRVINLNPIDYEKTFLSVLQKYNEGEYSSQTGNITLYENYSTTTYYQDARQENIIPETSIEKVKLAELSPLTPLIVIPAENKLPLVQTALEGYEFGNGAYIVPAIFLKYNDDKIRNDYIEKGVIITLDAATIALSGGTALATKVHWARRIWALAEVATAAAHIGVETGAITNEKIREVNDIFYMAMGVIGIKNLGKGVVHFAQNLPNNVRTLIRENKSIRNLILSKYLEYRIAITKLKNSDEWVDLPAEVRQQIIQQEKSFITLADAKNIPNDKWGVSNDAFLPGKTSEEILSIVKGKRPLVETYLRADYFAGHLAKFEQEGGAFVITKRSIRDSEYPSMSPRKFVGLPSEIDNIVAEANGNINVIINRLDLGTKFYKTGDEVFVIYAKSNKGFKFDMPNGNEPGANELWIPGGYTHSGATEAVLLNSGNLEHNNIWQKVVDFFGAENVKQITIK